MQRALFKSLAKNIAQNETLEKLEILETLATILGVIFVGVIILSVILWIVNFIYWLIEKFSN